MSTTLAILDCGRIGYAEAIALQSRMVRRRQAGEIPDVLLLLEHPPVVTLGRNAHAENLLRSPADLAAAGVELAECDRGGDVTFHGPGQLVGYPIFDLRSSPRPAFLPPRAGLNQLGPVDFVRALEEVLIRVAAGCGVSCQRIPGLTGVWTATRGGRAVGTVGQACAEGCEIHAWADAPVARLRLRQATRRGPGRAGAQGAPGSARRQAGRAAQPRGAPRPSMDPPRKLAAIGIHVSRGVTSHGFALNVDSDLAGFGLIVPCGLHGRDVTSLVRETGRPCTVPGVIPSLRRHFLDIFQRELAEPPHSWDHEGLSQTTVSEERTHGR